MWLQIGGILLPSLLLCAWGAIGLRQDWRLARAQERERIAMRVRDLANRLAADLRVREVTAREALLDAAAEATSDASAEPDRDASVAPSDAGVSFLLEADGSVIVPREWYRGEPSFDPPNVRESDLLRLALDVNGSSHSLETVVTRLTHPNLIARAWLEIASRRVREGGDPTDALVTAREIGGIGIGPGGYPIDWIARWRLAKTRDDTIELAQRFLDTSAPRSDLDPAIVVTFANRLAERLGDDDGADLRHRLEDRIERARHRIELDAMLQEHVRPRIRAWSPASERQRFVVDGSGDSPKLLWLSRENDRRIAGGLLTIVPANAGLFEAGDDVREEWIVATAATAAPAPDRVSAPMPGEYAMLRVSVPRDAFGARAGSARWIWIAGALALLACVVGVGSWMLVRTVRREMEVSRMKSEFVARVSHELKTPLASIRLFGEMLRDGRVADDAKRDQYQKVIVRESERLTRLIERVLGYARIERDELQLDKRSVAIDELVAETVTSFDADAAAKRVRIENAAPDGLPRVLADRDALAQVLWNLLDNARKYSADDAPIRVRLGVEIDQTTRGAMPDSNGSPVDSAIGGTTRVVLTVEDEGPGIAPEDRERIFDLFQRGRDDMTRGVGGVGLGLTIAKHFVDAHGGSIDVESRPGEGSRFAVRLPAESSPGTAVERMQREIPRGLPT